MDQLKEKIEQALQSAGCSLYEMEWDRKTKPQTLRIAIENLNGPTDLDTCTRASDAISPVLDEEDPCEGEYMLEVCSPGAERELKTDEQIARAAGQYVHVKLKQPKDGLDSVTGTLETAGDHEIIISYMVKGRRKKAVIDKDNIALIMTAVKF